MKQQSKGFTLIELVVVIAILGILAAVALPRFINVTDDAHESAIRGAGGALASAVLLVRSQWEVNRSKATVAATDPVAGFGAGNVIVNANGWPVSVSGGSAAGSAAACAELWENLLQGSAPRVNHAAGTVTNPEYVATVSGQACVYRYQAQNGGSTITYNTDTGNVVTDYVAP